MRVKRLLKLAGWRRTDELTFNENRIYRKGECSVTEGDVDDLLKLAGRGMLLSKDNHILGCELECFVDVLMYRGFRKEAEQLDNIASRIK